MKAAPFGYPNPRDATMRDIGNSPIFLRLGSRLRGPKETTKAGALRRVIIDNHRLQRRGVPDYITKNVTDFSH